MALKRIKNFPPPVKEEECNKDIILKAATGLFSQNGYAQTSIRDITKKSGLSIGTLYFHFKNKKDILKEIFMRLKPVFLDLTQKDTERIGFEEFFRKLCKKVLDHCLSNLGFYHLILDEGIKDAELGSFFYNQFKSDIKKFSQKFREYSNKGILRNIDHEKTAEIIVGTMLSLANFNGVFKNNIDENYLDDMLNFFVESYSKGIIDK